LLPGRLDPHLEVGDFLNALVYPHCQLILLVMRLPPRVALQIECQFPLSVAKIDLARLAGQRQDDELAVESRPANQANLKIEKGRESSKKTEKRKLEDANGRSR
jgi:hypothetical protein